MYTKQRDPADAAKGANALHAIRDFGFKLFPVKSREKVPLSKGWKTYDDADTDWAEMLAEGFNVGAVVGSGALVIDVDPRNGGDESFILLDGEFFVPTQAVVNTGGGGRHIYLAIPPGKRIRHAKLPEFPGIDFKSGAGAYVVAPGSIHPSGKAYRRSGKWPDALPTCPPDLLERLTTAKSSDPVERKGGGKQITCEMLATLLGVLDPVEFGAGGAHDDEWLPISMACHALTGGDGLVEWLDWCARDHAYGDPAREQNEYRWGTFDAEHKGGVTGATLFRAVSRAGHPELVAQADRTTAAEDFADLFGKDDEPPTDPKASQVAGLTYVRASDVEQKAIQWLWPNRVAVGKLTGIAGPPDQGKSQVTASIAAAVTTGGRFPDGGEAPLGEVIFLSAEDDPADTTAPRLEAAGADLTRVGFVNMLVSSKGGKRMFSFKDDLPRLRKLVESKPETKLIIVDPVSAYMGTGEVDTFKNSDVRGVLAPLGELATEFGVAVLFVTHFNKTGSGSAINRVTDSLAFTALSRSFWAVVPEVGADGDLTGRKLMVRIKQNIAAPTAGLAYRIDGVTLPNGINTSRVAWDGTVDMTADEVLSARPASEVSPKLHAARQFVINELAKGPMESELLKMAALNAGISEATFRRATADLQVKKTKRGETWWSELEI